MDKKHIIKIVKQYLNHLIDNDFDIKTAFIFGSFAKGTFHEDSDVDLAIVLNKLSNSFEMEVKSMTLRRKSETIVEPHLFDQKDFNSANPFANEILNSGFEIKLNISS